MPYLSRGDIQAADYYRLHASEQGYVRVLRERGQLLEIDNVAVDARELVRRRFVCNTLMCVKRKKDNGAASYHGSCCTDLVVHLAPHEAENLQQLCERGNALRDEFPKGVHKVIDRVLSNDFTYENAEHELCLRDRRSKACVMSYFDAQSGALLCAINTLCARLNLPLGNFKPVPCIDFPIHICEFEPGRTLLTLMSPRNFECMGGSREVVEMVCIRKPPPNAPPAYQFLKDTIVNRFGEEFYQRLDHAARQYLALDGQ